MVPSLVAMVPKLYLIVIWMVLRALPLAVVMYRRRIYFYKHTIHLMQKASTNEIPYMGPKTLNLGTILVSK